MRKYFFAVLAIAVIVMSGCKKKSSTDPTTPEEPVETSDSVSINVRIYATIDQMKYVDYHAFVTPQGEAEKELKMVESVALDKNYDASALNSINSRGLKSDSVLVYNFGMRIKKGEQSLRFSGTAKDTVMPKKIDFIRGYSFSKTVNKKPLEIDGDCFIVQGLKTDSLGVFLEMEPITGPFEVDVK